VRRRLSEQYEKLVRQKEQFDRWAAAREEELDQQAARLQAREEQLLQREVELQQQTQHWHTQHLRDQQEIRGLRLKLIEREQSLA